jgi:hypothetical protein
MTGVVHSGVALLVVRSDCIAFVESDDGTESS